jgi:DNA invertase Pin-like site-specific DNA recombinase
MPTAVIYTRCSSDEQAASGLGIEAQVEAARRWAAQHGYEAAGPFVDDGVGGATGLDRRPQLLEAIAGLSKGDVLLVAKRDRLGRDPLIVAMIESAVARKGCRIISAAGEGTEGDDPSNVLMRRMIDAFAEYERLIIKARTRAALGAKRRRGERYSPTPFGYDLAGDERTLVRNEGEHEVIAWVLGWRAEGRPLRWIAGELDRLGIRPKTGGERWSHTSIVRILERTTAA